MRLVMFRGKYAATWRENGKQRRVSLRTADRDQAERELADLKKKSGQIGTSVRDIISAYREDKSETASAKTMAYTQIAVLGFFGARRPDQIDRQASRAFIEKRRSEGKKDGTIRKELGFLRAALRWQDPNTTAVIEMPPEPPPRDRHLTRAECAKLRDAAIAPHIRLFIILALATGARAKAILELRWSQVDFERRLVSLGDGRKRKKGRATVPMTKEAEAALREARKAALTDFVIEHGAKPVGSVKRGFSGAAKRAGLTDGVSPHVLRHTVAVWMSEKEIPMPQIAAYLGHADSRVTERVYAKYRPDFLRKAAEALD